MVDNPIQMKDVVEYYAENGTNHNSSGIETDYAILRESVFNGSVNKSILENFLNKCRSDKADSYVTKILILESELENHGMDSIMDKFTDEIIPHTEDMDNTLLKIESHNIELEKKKTAKEKVRKQKIFKRIKNNHDKIKDKINLESMLTKYKILNNVEDFINEICCTVNKFKSPQYALLNIALEEVLFLNYYYALAIPRSYCVETVTNYFLSYPFDEATLNGYVDLLKKNRFITESDCGGISFLFESEIYPDSNDVQELIAKYKKDTNKNVSTLDKLIRKIYTLSPTSIIDSTPSIFTILRNALLISLFPIMPVTSMVLFMADKLVQMNLRRKEADRIRDYFKKEYDKIETKVESMEDGKKKEDLTHYMKCLDQCCTKINQYRDHLYTDKELDKEWDFEEFANMIPSIRLEEFKLIKLNNFNSLQEKVYEYIYANASDDLNPVGVHESVDENNILYHINNDDNRLFTCIESFEYNEDKVNEAHLEMTRLCEALNSTYGDKHHLFFYEYGVDNRMDLYLKDATTISLTESEEKEQASLFAGIDFDRVCDIEALNELINTISEGTDIEMYLSEAIAIKSKDGQEMVKDTEPKKAPQNIKPDKNTVEEDKKESKSFKLNLNSLKLSLMGIQKKGKELSAKEQQASRELDYTFNHIVKSINSAMTNDRREGIIKGSIIPSFSKCIKIGVGLAGVAYFVDPVLALIAVIGGLARSKHLNRKERLLLMDEVDIELKVVEKEISIAENNNDMKKLRDLMQYQKRLQRESQRLKYNMKVNWQGTSDGKVAQNTIGRNYGINNGGDD